MNCWKDKNMPRSLGDIQKGMLIVTTVIILVSLSGCGPSWTVVCAYDGLEKPVEEITIVFAYGPSVIVTAIDNKPCKCKYNLKYLESEEGNVARLCEWHLSPGKHSITAHSERRWGYNERYDMIGFIEKNWVISVSESLTVSANFQKGFVYELKGKTFYQDERLDRWQLFLEKKGTIEEVANSPAPGYCDDGKLYPYPYNLWKDAPRHWRDLRAAQHQKRN